MGDQLTNFLKPMLERVGTFVPGVVSALVLLVVAWIVASALRAITKKACEWGKLDQRTGSPVSKSVSDVVYWLTFLFFLPGILEALGLVQLLQPVQGMMNKILSFLPNLLGAVIVFTVGFFVAKLVRNIVTNLLATVGADNFSERIGLSKALGEKTSFSKLMGHILFAVIIVPVTQSALNVLGLTTITAPIQSMIEKILLALPNIIAALAVILIAYYLGRVVGNFISELLAGVGFNGVLGKLGFKGNETSGGRTPAQIVGQLVTVGIILFAIMEASSLMGFAHLSTIVSQFSVFAGQILLGVVVLALGLYLGNIAASAIRDSGMAHASTLATVTRISVIMLAGAMALRQMGLANEIVNLAFGLILGALALAFGIAFGLGGRDTAGSVVADWRRNLETKQVETKPDN